MALLAAFVLCLGAAPRTVTGNVVYRQRVAIPATALVTVTLEDAQGNKRSESSYVAGGAQSPLPFSLTVMPGAVSGGKYFLRAKIEADGKVLFASAKGTPVIGNGKYKGDLLVNPPVEKVVGLPLQGTLWTLIEIDGHQPAAGTRTVPSLILQSPQGTFRGSTGVNAIGGTYTIHDTILTIMPAMSTKMAGPPAAMEQERQLRRIFAETTGWKIDGNILTLKTGEDVLAKFRGEAAP